jgi:CHAD domain-containing protein
MYGIAKRRIQKRLKQVLKLEVYVHQPARVHELHLIRIAAKKLRYTLENLKSFYGPGIVKFIESAREIQSRLGALHDFDVWRASLPKFVRLPNQDKNLEAAVWFYDRQCQTLRQQTYRQFVQSWDRLKRKKVWDQLTQLVSSTAKRR